MKTFILAICATFSFHGVLLAQRSAPVLNPKSYDSPSGNWRLEVDPSELYGCGAGHYRMSAAGEEKWSATFPFTLCDAVVADDGSVAGYSYSHGLDGFWRRHDRASEPGDFRVVMIAPGGKLRRTETLRRKHSRYLHEPPEPVGTEVILDQARDRFQVRIQTEGRGKMSWWVYQLSTGKKLKQFPIAAKNESEQEHEVKAPRKVAAATIERRSLPMLGSFVLQGLAKRDAIRDIGAFDFDDRGRIGFLRRERQGYSFVLVQGTGEVLATISLPTMPQGDCACDLTLSWITGERWLTNLGQKNHSLGWWFDTGEGTSREFEGGDFDKITDAARTPDGGFLVLAERATDSSSKDELVAFDAARRERWKMVQNLNGGPESLFSPKAIAVTSRGKIGVLDVIRNTAQFFDANGSYEKTIDLKKAWRREPNYATKLSADVDGGYIVADFHGAAPFVWMKADGSVRRELRPMFDPNRRIDATVGIRCAPDGTLWVSDGQGLIRLSENGMATRVLGHKPNDDELEKITAVTADNHGHLFAIDERTGAVHVFDEAGKRTRICKPRRGDFQGNVISPHLAASDAGDVYVECEVAKPDHLHFAPDGRRVGIERLSLDDVSEERYPQNVAGRMLVLGYQAAFLVNQIGKTVRTIERRPNRDWLDRVEAAAVASNGAFAILASATGEYSSEQSINIYSAEGEPIRTIALGEHSLLLSGFDGVHVVLRKEGDTIIRDSRSNQAQSFTVAESASDWNQFLTREGHELWVTHFATGKVDRYAMPARE